MDQNPMGANDFRHKAEQTIEWIADYLASVDDYPVRAQTRPGEIAAKLPALPPRTPEPFEAVMRDFRDIIMPGMTHWQHPRFFAYFQGNTSEPSILAEMLISAVGAQCMSWETSPAATELEIRVLEWLRDMVGLPDGFAGSIQDTASTASLCSLIAARERATEGRGNEDGLSGGPTLTAYCSEEAHSSIERAVRLGGIGSQYLRRIPVDEHGAMNVTVLSERVREDIAGGARPAWVVASLGGTSYGAMDLVAPIAEVAREVGAWVHVDAAWAGSALILPELRHLAHGLELADSVVLNPHKWLFTNLHCSALFVRRADEYVRAFAIQPEYLKTRHGDAVVNFRDWGIQLGRRFRALKLWFVIRMFGVDELQRRIRQHIAWAERLAGAMQATPGFQVVTEPSLSLFTFRYVPDVGWPDPEVDAFNERLLMRINDAGRAYLSHTRVRGRYVIRFVVGQTNTTWEDVEIGWQEIRRCATEETARPSASGGR
jgi:aromatic-L-amino-acid decarboxylase